MRLKFALYIAILPLIFVACDVFDAPSPDANAVWRAWLANEDGQIITVDARGEVDENPALPADFEIIAHDATQDTFTATGERLSLQFDTRFDRLSSAQFNTVLVEESIDRINYPFFFSPNLNLGAVNFVQNGERILIYGEDVDAIGYWILIERDGSLVRPLRSISRTDVHGTAQGFVYTTMQAGDTQLISVNTRRVLSDALVWTGAGEWHIIHVEIGANGYGPFMNWQPLGVPVYSVPTATPIITTPTAFPSPEPILYAGIQAVVNTVDGEVLYLRDEASTGGEIVRYLYDRMIVDLLEGPVYADGYKWWRIRTEEGETGWAAEAVDTVTTLLPLSTLEREATDEPED